MRWGEAFGEARTILQINKGTLIASGLVWLVIIIGVVAVIWHWIG